MLPQAATHCPAPLQRLSSSWLLLLGPGPEPQTTMHNFKAQPSLGGLLTPTGRLFSIPAVTVPGAPGPVLEAWQFQLSRVFWLVKEFSCETG